MVTWFFLWARHCSRQFGRKNLLFSQLLYAVSTVNIFRYVTDEKTKAQRGSSSRSSLVDEVVFKPGLYETKIKYFASYHPYSYWIIHIISFIQWNFVRNQFWLLNLGQTRVFNLIPLYSTPLQGFSYLTLLTFRCQIIYLGGSLVPYRMYASSLASSHQVLVGPSHPAGPLVRQKWHLPTHLGPLAES